MEASRRPAPLIFTPFIALQKKRLIQTLKERKKERKNPTSKLEVEDVIEKKREKVVLRW